MKKLFFILTVFIFSCSNRQQSAANTTAPDTNTPQDKKLSNKVTCWTGTLNGKTPVFIHYQSDSNVIIGAIIYLNTKDKLPIKLLGTIEEDSTYRLLEFDSKGNITGVIEGRPTAKNFNGTWVSPKTKKELAMTLVPKDTLLTADGLMPDNSQLYGNYHYQYGETGYSGDFEIIQLPGNKAAFSILSLTNIERGPNIAEVEKDTVSFSGSSFIYKIPGSDSCEFKVRFYKGFAYIDYTKGFCESQFGLNATIDGIYLKTD